MGGMGMCNGMGGMGAMGMGVGVPMTPPVAHNVSSPAMLQPSRAPAGKADILSMYSSGAPNVGRMAPPQMPF
eukprot:scaffold176669_cov28-Tisochrysis_lutea.AAC.3